MCDTCGNILKSNKGMALLLAVTVMSLLVAVTLEFNKNMRQELVGSVTVKENSQLGAIMKSGYNLAEAVLLQDGRDNQFDSAYDRWAKLEDSNLSRFFGGGSLELSIGDLAGKLQLNSLGSATKEIADNSRLVLERMLLTGEFGDLSGEEVSLIVDAITDWVDADDKERGIEETESSYYRSIEEPYFSKNGAFEYMEELLLVRGLTRELYWGTADFKGLRNFVTVHGTDGKININSAPLEILMAIHEDMTEELARKMVTFREDEENSSLLQDNNWYKNVVAVELDEKIITTSSSFFVINAKAKYGKNERKLSAVVLRDPVDTLSLVSRKVE